ncbi:Crp/Fnr family transcriptional regulator [Desulfococcaceae bacterium HSG9]|nr:Crp/Fnr family transcriptional regulator [Desulfococcaceae bacterium HSG9]
MQNILSVIAKTPLFKGLPENQLKEIQRITVSRSYNKGEAIFFEGDECNGFYIIAQGQVKVFKLSFEGKEHILHILGPGEPFGEVPVFSGRPFPANSQSLVKSRLLFLPRAAFIKLITANPSLSLNMFAILSMRLREFTVQIENLSLKEVPGRVASYLLYQSDEQGHHDFVDLRISKKQLASMLGATPETLSRMFAKMSDQGLIEVQGRLIRILDRQRLTTI